MTEKENEELAPLIRAPSLNSIPEHSTLDLLAKEKENPAVDYRDYSLGMQILLFTIMVLVNVLGPLSTEAQVPALQDIAKDLNTTSELAQLTITIYMLSFGASQLLFGTLSDMYGRRRTLIVGLVIYVITNATCALSVDIVMLNVSRAFQAMGSGAGMVIVYAIARDVFTMDKRTQVLGFLGGSRPIIIAASPIFGGTVASYLGWRYIFWIIGGLSLCLLVLVVLFLPETCDASTVHITTAQEYWDTVKKLVKKRIFVGLVLISGAIYGGVFIMFNEFSFIMENRYGFSEFVTGLLCGAIVFGLLIGSLVSIGFVRILNPMTVICIGIGQIFLCGCLLVIPVIMYSSTWPELVGLNFWWTTVPLFLYICADGLMLPHLVSTALEPFKDCAGTASALAGFWRFFSAASFALAISSSSSHHTAVLHLGTASMAFLAAIIYVITLFGVETGEFTGAHNQSRLELKNDVVLTQEELDRHDREIAQFLDETDTTALIGEESGNNVIDMGSSLKQNAEGE